MMEWTTYRLSYRRPGSKGPIMLTFHGDEEVQEEVLALRDVLHRAGWAVDVTMDQRVQL